MAVAAKARARSRSAKRRTVTILSAPQALSRITTDQRSPLALPRATRSTFTSKRAEIWVAPLSMTGAAAGGQLRRHEGDDAQLRRRDSRKRWRRRSAPSHAY